MALKVGLVVPHIFMQDDILPDVIFSPGQLALELCNELVARGVEVTLFSPGPVTINAHNITADLSSFQAELSLRGDTYIELLKKHPLTFITLARQVQAEIIAKAYQMANQDEFDVIHIYTNEEDIALPFAKFCKKPVVFTHHDPFNFLAGYRANFPKYSKLHWLSISDSQRRTMPNDTQWLGTIYHGLNEANWPAYHVQKEDYIAYIGRIIEPKGVHLAIQAIQVYNQTAEKPITLKIAGKHYSDKQKKNYWQTHIEPYLDDPHIEYIGFIKDTVQKQQFLATARALIIPSTFDEPFGMVMIEALACSTPLIGLDSGAIPEVIDNGKTGWIVHKEATPGEQGKEVINDTTIANLAQAIAKINLINPNVCRKEFLERFTIRKMAAEHISVYEKLIKS